MAVFAVAQRFTTVLLVWVKYVMQKKPFLRKLTIYQQNCYAFAIEITILKERVKREEGKALIR